MQAARSCREELRAPNMGHTMLGGCASVGSQVKDACPESRDLYCGSAGHRCSEDETRGCKVCRCGAQQSPAGGVPQPRPLSNPTSKPP